MDDIIRHADPTAQLSGTLRVGVELRDFDTRGSATEPFALANLTYQITPRLFSNLSLGRAIVESTNQDFDHYDQNLIRLRLTQQITAKVSGFAEGSFELDEFKDRATPGTPNRRFDRIYEFGLGGDYQFARWLQTGLSYLYRTKDSSISVLEYVDHRLVLRIRALF